jgi:maleylpyruvate isomerase
LAILDYLEETYPKPALLPAGVRQRALARQVAQIINSGVQPIQNVRLQSELRDLGVDPLPLVRQYITRGLGAVEQLVASESGRFLIGDQVTHADICVVPQLYVARRFQVPVQPFQRLLAAERECSTLESFRRAHPDSQPDAQTPA